MFILNNKSILLIASSLLLLNACCPAGHPNLSKKEDLINEILPPNLSSMYDDSRVKRLAKRINLHKDVVPVSAVDGSPMFWAVPRTDSFKGLTNTVQQNGQVINVFDAWVPKGNSTSDGYHRVNYFLYKFASANSLSGNAPGNDQYVHEAELWRFANDTWCPVFSKMDISLTAATERTIKYRKNSKGENFIDVKIFTGSSDGFIGELGFRDHNPMTTNCNQNDIRVSENAKYFYQPQRQNDDQLGRIITLKTVPIHTVVNDKGNLEPSKDASGNIEKVLLATTGATCYYNFSSATQSGCMADKVAWGNVLLGYYTEGDDTPLADIPMINWTPGEWIGTRYKEYDSKYHYYAGQNIIDADLVVTKLDAKNSMFNIRLVITPDGEKIPPMRVNSGASTKIDLPYFQAVRSNYEFIDFTKYPKTLNRPEGLTGARTKRSYILDNSSIAMTFSTEQNKMYDGTRLIGPQAVLCWTDECQKLSANFNPATQLESIGDNNRFGVDGSNSGGATDAVIKPNLDLFHDSYWLGDADFLRIMPLDKFLKYGNEKSGMLAVTSNAESFARKYDNYVIENLPPADKEKILQKSQCIDFTPGAKDILNRNFNDKSVSCSYPNINVFQLYDKQSRFVNKEPNIPLGHMLNFQEFTYGGFTSPISPYSLNVPKNYYEWLFNRVVYLTPASFDGDRPKGTIITYYDLIQPIGVPISKATAFYYSLNKSGKPEDDRVMIYVRITDNSEFPVLQTPNNPTIQNDGGFVLCAVGRRDISLPLSVDNLAIERCGNNSAYVSPSNVFSSVKDSRNVMTTPRKITHSMSPDGKLYLNYFAKNHAFLTGAVNSFEPKNQNVNWKLINYGRKGQCDTTITDHSKKAKDESNGKEDPGFSYLKDFSHFIKTFLTINFFAGLDVAADEFDAPPGSIQFLEAAWEFYEMYSDAKEGPEVEIKYFTLDPTKEIRTNCVID